MAEAVIVIDVVGDHLLGIVADLLHAFIEPFLKGETPKGMFE